MAGSQGNIVVVEDDAGLNQALSRLLQAAGFHAASFVDAASAMQAGTIGHADCLVLDMHLTDMSGYELHRRLSEGTSRVPPTIIITAHDDVVSRQQAQNMGAVAYLTKPFAGRALVDAVIRAIGA